MSDRLIGLFGLCLFLCVVSPVFASVTGTCGPDYRIVGGAVQGILHPVPVSTADTTRMRAEIRAGESKEPGVSIVVPVYRELGNGNLIRLIDGFTKQSAAGANFELVMVVNNTPEVAHGGDGTSQHIFKENQETMALLRFINDPKMVEPARLAKLDPFERAVVLRARERGLRVRVVDKSTEGTARNIGEIRDFGVNDVAGRYPPGVRKRIVAMMDGDTKVPTDYVENLMVHFATRPIDVLYLPMEFRVEPGSEQWLYETSAPHRLDVGYNLFQRALHGDPRHGGPQIVTTNDALKEVGGIPHFARGEDSVLAEKLGRLRVGHGTDTTVLTNDRARPDGYDSKIRFDNGDSQYTPTKEDIYPMSFTAGRALQELFARRRETPERIDSIFKTLGLPYTAKDFLAARTTAVRNGVLPEMARSRAVEKFLKEYGLGPFDVKAFKAIEGIDHDALFAKDGIDTVKAVLTIYLGRQGKAWNETLWDREVASEKFPGYYSRDTSGWQFQILDNLHPDKGFGTKARQPWDIGMVAMLAKKLPAGEHRFFTDQLKAEENTHDEGAKLLAFVLLNRVDGRTSVPEGAMNHPLVREFMTGNEWLAELIAKKRGAGKGNAQIFLELRESLGDWLRPFEQTPFKKRLMEITVLTRFVREAENHPERYPELLKIVRTMRGDPP